MEHVRINKNIKLGLTIFLALTLFSVCGCTAAEIPEPSVSVKPTLMPLPTPTPWVYGEIISDSGDLEINSEVLRELKPRTYEFDYAPAVLIYHTHATEAFLQTEDYTYEESAEWRSEDNEKNIVYVGEVLKSQLEGLGFIVIHDTTNVEPPLLSSAYSRSLDVMKRYEDIDIYIDVHRNAAQVGAEYNTVYYGGKDCARMFFVVGTGIGTYEGEYDTAPEWEENYTLARSVQQSVLKRAPGMMKPIRMKVGRYNQHMGMCLLIEIGNNANTMDEILNAVPYLAKGLGEVIIFEK